MGFSKTTLTAKTLAKELYGVAVSSPQLVSALTSNRVSKPFSETLMLAVTSVYECRYCTWMHSAIAEKVGIDEENIDQILNGELANVDESRQLAIEFAVEYAKENSTAPNLSAKSCHQLCDNYGDDMATDIIRLVQFVSFTNKLGNTFDAFLARWLDDEPRSENVLFTGSVFVTMLPLYMTVSALTKKGKNPFSSLDT